MINLIGRMAPSLTPSKMTKKKKVNQSFLCLQCKLPSTHQEIRSQQINYDIRGDIQGFFCHVFMKNNALYWCFYIISFHLIKYSTLKKTLPILHFIKQIKLWSLFNGCVINTFLESDTFWESGLQRIRKILPQCIRA